jgi:List-Bact-rpt repeat protein
MKGFRAKRAIALMGGIRSGVGRRGRWKALSILLLLLMAGLGAREAAAGVIFVTSLDSKISTTGGCSLQEAIYSANFDDNVAIRFDLEGKPYQITTQCLPGQGDDVIVLPTKAVLVLDFIVSDDINPAGPTATPIITSNVKIEAHGATLQHGGSESFRAFTVASSAHLTLRNAVVKGFVAKGGDGGKGGGGGGLGAGGAIYVRAGGLFVEGCTFEGNGAIGGNGGAPGYLEEFGESWFAPAGAGGGGLGGNGASPGHNGCLIDGGNGGGGGGARSDGSHGGSCEFRAAGGAGGGTYPLFQCGGKGGHFDGPIDGQDGQCPGGGGGGGSQGLFTSGHGGNGEYGGGGGGASESETGGHGGFGGGGGAGWEGILGGSTGGDGGFGGGGGSGPNGSITDGDPGEGGLFAGNANHVNGGGGAALGGAIFSEGGTVLVQNSTFTANFVSRGNGGNAPNSGQGANGTDAGGAIFSVDGHLTVLHSTVVDNEATGYGDGIVVIQTFDSVPTSFTLRNTMIAYTGETLPAPGPRQCSWAGFSSMVTEFAGNVVRSNDLSAAPHPFEADWSGCGDPITGVDPGVGALAANGGPTPTMAISESSPAFDAADTGVTLPTDQRGQERPAEEGFDIGAFELCFEGPEKTPCIILSGLSDSDPILTMQVSPDGAGTTTPSAGTHREPLSSVVLISAQPGIGYKFLNWSGDVTDATNPQTTVVMNQDKTVTANFELLPDFTLSAISPLSLIVGGNGSRTVTANANVTFSQAVTLSASGLPVGATSSFNPTSVTPAASSSASSQLTVALGPSVLPGSYTLSVTGTSGALVHSTPLALTVVASPAGVSQVISTLGNLGCIDNAGVVNAFKAKLAQAQAAIDAGDYQTAINLLSALLQQLQAQAGKHLKTTCTDANGNTFDPVQTLIQQVTSILSALGTNLKANPITGTLVNSSNIEVAGATINIMSSSRTIVSATTDATGFYVFPKITALKLGMDYTVKVTLPKGYKLSTPTAQVFKWNATMVALPKFVVK